ncbi:unnamed protein product [Urochloa humidicola]
MVTVTSPHGAGAHSSFLVFFLSPPAATATLSAPRPGGPPPPPASSPRRSTAATYRYPQLPHMLDLPDLSSVQLRPPVAGVFEIPRPPEFQLRRDHLTVAGPIPGVLPALGGRKLVHYGGHTLHLFVNLRLQPL